MKKSSNSLRRSRPHGFTLVELLVVIAIIAILAGVLLQAGTYALQAAQRTKAFNLATTIQSSVMNYYTEYSVYPDDTTAFPAGQDYILADTDAANWKNMLVALSGNINPQTQVATTSTVANTRGIVFLSLKTSDIYSATVIAPKNPLPPDTTHLYFNLAIDNDYDGILGVAPSHVTTMPNFTGTFSATGGGTSSAGAAVWANCPGSSSATAAAGNYVHTY
jgi:prepilin-type N-terminal cleavage/methylation domain-containing protein